jgi:hypothetical protein
MHCRLCAGVRDADRSSRVNTYAWLRKRMPKRLITLAPMAIIVESLSVHGLWSDMDGERKS